MGSLIESIQAISINTFMLAALTFVVAFVIASYRWYLLLPYLGFKIFLSLAFIGQFYSIVLPGQMAGDIVKAYRIGKGKVDAEHLATSVFIDKFCGLIGILCVSIIGIAIAKTEIPVEISTALYVLALFFLIGFFTVKVAFVYKLLIKILDQTATFSPRFGTLVLRIVRVLEAWVWYLNYPLKLFYVFIIAGIVQFICVWMNIILAADLGLNIQFSDWCWICGLVAMAVFLPFSIGGIGIREGAYVGLLSLFGVPVEKSIALSLAVFAISLLGALIGGLLELFRVVTSSSISNKA